MAQALLLDVAKPQACLPLLEDSDERIHSLLKALKGIPLPVERVSIFLKERGYEGKVMQFAQSTKTAPLAAEALGVRVGQIAKTLCFMKGQEAVLAVTSGDRRISQSKLKEQTNWTGKIGLADAACTFALTGYLPGGVCPFALPSPIPVLVDRSLGRFPTFYPAAGSPNSAVPMNMADLLVLTGGRLCDLSS